MWAMQAGALQEAGRVWAPDLPGFGAAPPLPRGTEAPEALADWVAARMEEQGLRSAGVAGYSMGGTVALLLALRHPWAVSRLALCCSSACWGRGVRRPIALAFAGLGRRRAMDLFEKSVLWGFSRHCREPSLRPQVLDMVARADRESMLWLYRAFARADLRGRLPEIAVPTLVVGGTRDWLAPPAHQRALATGIGGARLRLLRGADHILCLGRAGELASALAEFFGRRTGAEEEDGRCA